ncbi:hypothetical protein [Clostridium botulinum]|uniref:hypothetical protein n=1 Tax=Clostridium botulinum TaxID=1491 RepID=UPI001E2B5EDF|nr:hypothetical protein [Clostridium botulinum]
MSGNAKPNIKKLGKEGEIKFIHYNSRNNTFDDTSSLSDGSINNKTGYGCLLNVTYNESKGQEENSIIFEVFQKSNIWAYGQSYSDGGGSTPANLNLFKKEKESWKIIRNNIKTKDNEWYLLFENIDIGTYKLEVIGNYVSFTEWYIEKLKFCSYLLKQNNQYYSVKSSFYKLGEPENNQELEKWYKKHGISNLNELIKKKNSKSVDLKLDKNDIYKTTISIDFSEIANNIEYIDEDNQKEIEYNVKEYQLLNLVKEKIGSKFQIGKWEEGDNIE